MFHNERCSLYSDSLFIIWLAASEGNMNKINRCDWLPSRQDGAILPAQDCAMKHFLKAEGL